MRKEGERMLGTLRDTSCVVALQVKGRALTSEELAAFIQRQSHVREICFCIGGPDGLAPEVDSRASLRWSISALTLPHALVRVVIAEALYRAVTIIKGHPYHRA
jgi:23S rRNA (pseudouridine1915-N3)-methyltransferase